MVRAKGIEPSSSAWEADVLPLYHAREWFAFYSVVQRKSRKYLTFAKIRGIIDTQIPKIAIKINPVRSMRVVHQPASFALDGGFGVELIY